jgi:ribosomal protein L37AE/L43A
MKGTNEMNVVFDVTADELRWLRNLLGREWLDLRVVDKLRDQVDKQYQELCQRKEKRASEKMSDLLPCPFCGSDDHSVLASGWRECSDCGAACHASRWNLRANRWAAFSEDELHSIFKGACLSSSIKPSFFEEIAKEDERRKAEGATNERLPI